MFLVIFEQQKLAHVNMEKALDKDEVFWKKIKFKVAWHVESETQNTFTKYPKLKIPPNLSVQSKMVIQCWLA